MTVQNRAFHQLADSVWVQHNNVAQIINLNYNNGTRTLRIVNEATSLGQTVHVKTRNVETAATTTNSMSVLTQETVFMIIRAGQTQISTISAQNAATGYHLTLGDGGV